uniref:Uncharacterized protein n=1 Tax=Avena sativa TaxID=4498 RepID=A0ACD5XRG8_AVESA
MSKTPTATEKGKGVGAEGSGNSAPPASRRRRPSSSPAPRRGRNPPRRGGGELVIRERVVRESSGNATYPTLTRSNYAEWAMVMRVQLQAARLWDVIEYGADDDHDNRAALTALLRAVPPEMVRTLAAKDCAKTAWETIKTMRLGSERVREAKAQTRRHEWEDLRFKSGESIEDFSMRLTAIVSDLELLGDPVDEYKAVLKYLCTVPRKYRPVVMAIEQTMNLRELTIEDLTGRLITAEEGYELDDAIDGVNNKLLLSEEEWKARQQQRGQGSSSSGQKGYPKQKVQSGDKDKGATSAPTGGNGGTPRRHGNCRYCGKAGHWAKECRKAQRDRERKNEVANLAEEQGEPPALLLASIDVVTEAPEATMVQAAPVTVAVGTQAVFLNEEKVVPVPAAAGVWYLDTGASSHMTGVRDAFVTLDESVKGSVRFGDGSLVEIGGKGNLLFRCTDGNQRVLAGVFFIPRLRTNIISLGQLDENGCKSVIEGGYLRVYDQQRRLLVRVKRAANRLYILNLNVAAPVCLLSKVDTPAWVWHARLGHLHFRAVNTMSRRGMVRGMPEIDHIDEICDGCTIGKQHRLAFPRASKHCSERALELVHTDLCGPIKLTTAGGNQYFLLVVDDCTRYMWLELLKSKDEAFARFRKIQALAEAKQQCRLRAFRSDRGGEFNSGEIKAWCAQEGVEHFTTAPYSPQQNGVVERRNQTVVEMARCMLKGMSMPAMFLGEAVKCAVYVLNRAPTRSLNGVTPYEAWHRRKPTVEHLRTFGCVAHMKRTGPGITKLSDRSILTVFVGYEEGSKAYRVYDPVGGKLYVTRDVAFEERRTWSWALEQGGGAPPTFTVEYVSETGEAIVDSGHDSCSSACPRTPSPSAGQAPAGTPTTSLATAPTSTSPAVQLCTPPSRDSTLDAADDAAKPHRYRRVENINDTTVPQCDPLGTGDDDEPPASDDLDNDDADAEVCCLMAAEEPATVEEALASPAWRRAMEEEMGSIIDNETWALSSLPTGHRAIGLKWVFKLKKDPEGNVVKHKASPLEHAVYRRGDATNYLLVGVYVDDLIITGTHVEEIKAFKSEMHRLFKMSDLGLLSYYLGIEVRQGHGEITLCQRAYAEKILERAKMGGCNPCCTPMEARLKLQKEDGAQKVDATEYRGIIGCLRYLVNTRPDIALAVGVASRFMEAPSTHHWAVVKQILRYVRGTLGYGCRYRKGNGEPELIGYSDSDLAGDVNDRKSTSGVVFFLGGSIVTWSSQKQKMVAVSSCEAEYVAAAAATCQGTWLSRLISDLTGQAPAKFQLFVDNKSAIALSKNPVHQDRSKHIDIKFHHIRQCLEEGKLDVDHVRTDGQLADILTKALGRTRFVEMRARLGVVKVQV